MKQILRVFSFETKQRFRQKTFIVSIVISALIFFAITFAPRFISGNENKMFNPNTSENVENKKELAIFNLNKIDNSVINALSKKYKLVEMKSEEELRNKIKLKEFSEGIVLKSELDAKVYSSVSKLSDFGNNEIEKILKENYKYNIGLKEAGIDVNKLNDIESVTPKVEVESFSRNPISGFVLSYFGVMFLYMMIILHGNSIATNVAKEKESRTMEILITNVKSKALIIGKVLSGVFASLVHLMVTLGAGLIGIYINLQGNDGVKTIIKTILSEIKYSDLAVLIIFTLIGVTLYYFIFAALGSLVSRLDELNQALTPAMILVMIAFFVPMFSMSNADGIVMKIASFIPFTSPLAMLTRFLMTSVPLVEVIISFVLLIIFTLLFALISVKIYRQGTLSYGNKLNIIKALTQKIE
ncbi:MULTISPECIES: ABC transporter permease [Helcococcus]|uniref:ABC transporter permease n=1 Tax=Helcococcus bovis TaxID=3153252 RepID=A0ABW9F562_9FIRM